MDKIQIILKNKDKIQKVLGEDSFPWNFFERLVQDYKQLYHLQNVSAKINKKDIEALGKLAPDSPEYARRKTLLDEDLQRSYLQEAQIQEMETEIENLVNTIIPQMKEVGIIP